MDFFVQFLPEVQMRDEKDDRGQKLEITEDQFLQLGFLQELQSNKGNSGFPSVNEFTMTCYARRLSQVETRLGPLTATAEAVRDAFNTLYDVTSTIIPQAGLRFEGEVVIVPRPIHPLSVAHCLAIATVVKRIGFDVELEEQTTRA